MFFIKKILFVIMICSSVAACDQSDKEQAGENSTSSNTAESPLIIPNDTTSTNLQDIWVLDSLNNKAPDSNYFAHGTPFFDFNLDKGSISGHTGCNGLNGKLKVNGAKLSFDSLVVSKGVCNDKGFEKKLLSGFRSGKTSYKILNGKLYLNIGPGAPLIFRRIRR